MVLGAPGLTGLSVPRGVVEELRPGGDSVTVQPRPTVVQTVRGITLRRDSATLSPALSQVTSLNSTFYILNIKGEHFSVSTPAISKCDKEFHCCRIHHQWRRPRQLKEKG